MQDNEGAGAGQDDGQGGSGAPSGGSPEGGSENELEAKFEKRIKAALASQKQHYEAQLGNVRAEFEAFKAGSAGSKKQDAEPQRYSRVDLKALVDAGKITQEQADDQWALQVREEARQDAVAAATAAVAGKSEKERVEAQIESYKRLKPEIMEEGSELRGKVKEEFDHLVNVVGMPGRGEGVLKTQLAAIRAAVGPLEKLENAAKATRAKESEQQGGGSGGKPGGQGGGSGKKLSDHLNADAKDYYAKGIKSGRYKDWDAVDAELKYASPNTRRRLGLPAA